MYKRYEYGIRVKFRSELGAEVTTAEPFFVSPYSVPYGTEFRQVFDHVKLTFQKLGTRRRLVNPP